MRILVTGGAGFVGAALSRQFKKRNPAATVVAFDSLKRRGSEFNLPLLKSEGVEFVHGDIRIPSDLQSLDGDFDLCVECSAEPSVLSGLDSSPQFVFDTNLTGTLNCLEFSRTRVKRFIFLSTSRVYSIEPLRKLTLKETSTRFEVAAGATTAGVSERGIAEDFPVLQARSYYGASKLASELLIQEYAAFAGLSMVINRCGVIAGPGQFGKSDQGVFTMWVARHLYGGDLKYIGFGGEGKQVRDLLHPEDLFTLIEKQLEKWDHVKGQIWNVGGGSQGSVSLVEYHKLCESLTGQTKNVTADKTTTAVDIPYYVSDNSRIEKALGWTPKKSPNDIVQDIATWLRENETTLRPLFGR